MRPRCHQACTFLLVWALGAGVGCVCSAGMTFAQADEPPILIPPKPAAPVVRRATLVVTCDLACNWYFEGQPVGHIDAGGSAEKIVVPGKEYLVTATTDDGVGMPNNTHCVIAPRTEVSLKLIPWRDDRLAEPGLSKACDGGDLDACVHLGIILGKRESTSTQEEVEREAAAFKKACDGGIMRGCSRMGWIYYLGFARGPDNARADALWKKACDGGDADGCNGLGYENANRNSPGHWAFAKSYYRKACDGGNLSACTELGTLFNGIKGEPDLVQDYGQAKPLFEKACEGGDMAGCTELGYAYQLGRAVAKDPGTAAELFEKSCDGGDSRGCRSLGYLYEIGLGVRRDYAKARAYYAKGDDPVGPTCDKLR